MNEFDASKHDETLASSLLEDKETNSSTTFAKGILKSCDIDRENN